MYFDWNVIKEVILLIDFQTSFPISFQILLRECEFRRVRNEKMSNMSEGSRARLLSNEDQQAGSETGSETGKSSSSKKSSKKGGSGRRSPSPLMADAKRRASSKIDSDDSS